MWLGDLGGLHALLRVQGGGLWGHWIPGLEEVNIQGRVEQRPRGEIRCLRYPQTVLLSSKKTQQAPVGGEQED